MWLELDVGDIRRVHLGDHLAPEHARLHDVGLFHRADLVAARARQLEGDARDAGDLDRVVELGVDAALLAVAEVDDVRAARRSRRRRSARARSGCRGRRPPRASATRRRRAPDSTSPGAGWRRAPSSLRRRSSAALGPHRRRARSSHFGPPTAPNSTASAACALRHGLVGHRHAVRVVGGAADQVLLDLEARGPGCVEPGDDLASPRPSPRGRCRRRGEAGACGLP